MAARNALAICTGVIVFRTIPTSHLWIGRVMRRNQDQECPVVRWHIP
ncbi:hypothetical protein C4K40_0262 [Pseudomonas sp. CMR5c]|nr:hypothetical protein C4K40_0262 [Pseudomonas sp. CMR5c]